MKGFAHILHEGFGKDIAKSVYDSIFSYAIGCKDPDGSFQCHMSVRWAKQNLTGELWWHKDLVFIEWDERKWKKISEKLIAAGAIKNFSQKPIKNLIEDISDMSVNGHSLLKFQGYYIDPYLKSLRVSESAIQKFGKFWESIR
jgi:hypothetical protein